MAETLSARFVKRFPGGAEIRGALEKEGKAVTVLFGPSGCGKTTMLRCLAGLERPEEGFIRFGGETWFDAQRRVFVPARKRGVGLLFQDYALFPHLSVAANVGYGLKGLAAGEVRGRVGEWLERFDLSGMEGRKPHQLSGGQPMRCPAGSGSGWRWHGHWPRSRGFCCWTSRFPRWTPHCARSFRGNCGGICWSAGCR